MRHSRSKAARPFGPIPSPVGWSSALKPSPVTSVRTVPLTVPSWKSAKLLPVEGEPLVMVMVAPVCAVWTHPVGAAWRTVYCPALMLKKL